MLFYTESWFYTQLRVKTTKKLHPKHLHVVRQQLHQHPDNLKNKTADLSTNHKPLTSASAVCLRTNVFIMYAHTDRVRS